MTSSIIRPDCIIIGEPTSLELINAHKGHISYSIQVVGSTGHSSNPDDGVNSIEIMHNIIENLISLKKYLKQKYENKSFQYHTPL